MEVFALLCFAFNQNFHFVHPLGNLFQSFTFNDDSYVDDHQIHHLVPAPLLNSGLLETHGYSTPHLKFPKGISTKMDSFSSSPCSFWFPYPCIQHNIRSVSQNANLNVIFKFPFSVTLYPISHQSCVTSVKKRNHWPHMESLFLSTTSANQDLITFSASPQNAIFH